MASRFLIALMVAALFGCGALETSVAPQEWIWSSRAEPSLIGLSVLVNEGTVPVVTLQVNV